MILNDNFFNKVEKKTKVNKSTIMGLASKLQKNNLKDETTLREVIKELGGLSGRTVTKEQEDKIVKAVVEDKVPKDLSKLVDEK